MKTTLREKDAIDQIDDSHKLLREIVASPTQFSDRELNSAIKALWADAEWLMNIRCRRTR